MKRTYFFLIVLIGVLSGCSGIASSPDELGYGEIEFTMPQAEEWQLSNGLKVYYYFNDELPQVRGRLYLPGGSLFNDTGITGLAGATGTQMREGGVPGYSPEALDKYLDNLAASIESSFGSEYGTVSFFCLSEDFEKIFALFGDVVRKPAFNEKRLSLWKTLASERIRRRRDNPEIMASMAFADLVYGDETAYSKTATYKTIDSISRGKMKAFHQRFVRPDHARLAITGAIPREQMEKAIEQLFGDWQASGEALPEIPKAGLQAAPGLYVLERDFDQATVIIGHRGPPRLTEDLYEMKVYNRIFGHGGFGSLLFREVRSRLGLAYSVYGGLWPDIGEGTFQIVLQTRNDGVVAAVKEAVRLARLSANELPNEDDFLDAKSATERSFVFKFAKPDSIVDRAAFLDVIGYPKDYDASFLEKMKQVDAEKVLEVGKRWVEPDDFVIVVVGGASVQELTKGFADQGLAVRRMEFDTEPSFADLPPVVLPRSAVLETSLSGTGE